MDMNILIVSAVFPPEPVVSANISFQLAMELGRNNKVIVLCPRPTRPNGKKIEVIDYSKKNFKVVHLRSYTCPQSDFIGRMKESISFGNEVARYIKTHSNEIKCVYANTWPIFAQYKTIKASRHNNIPIVLHVQDIYPESMLPRLGFVGKIMGFFLRWMDSFYLKRASIVIAISEQMKNYLVRTRKLDIDRVRIIRNWQDESAFETDNITGVKEKFTYMFVGSISPAAGVDFIIKAFIKADIEDACLVIAGDGSSKQECRRLASVSDSIEFISVSPQMVPSVQAKADVLLLPLKKGIGKTASPSKLPAYMFSAKPVLASVDPGSDVEYVIKESGCGFVCDAEDMEEFISLLVRIKKLSEHNRKLMGQNGRSYALKYMSQKNNLPLITNVITQSCIR